MVRKRKLSGKDFALFGSGVIVGLAIALWWATARPPSFLTKDLPLDWSAGSSEFDARIRARFPVGTPVGKFINALSAEGFEPTWSEQNGEYGAMRDESSFVCNIAARVYWRPGNDGTVSAVRGIRREEGCL